MGLGKTYSTKYLLDSNNNRGAVGQVLSTTATGIDWVNANTVPGAGLWIESGNNIYNSNSGNVGIGTTSPDVKLQIINSDTTQNILSLSNQNNANLAFDFGRVVSTGALSIQGRQTGYNNILLAPTSGNVGIGADNPRLKLEVQGIAMPLTNDPASVEDLITLYRNGSAQVWSGGATLSLGRYITGDGSNPNSRLDFKLKNAAGSNTALPETTVMTMQSNGNVGIGTTSPGSKLEVIASGTNSTLELDNSDTQYTLIQFNAQSSVKGFAGYNSGFMLFGGESSIDTRLQAGGSYALSINASSRNVSIGSTSDFGVNLAVDKSVMVGSGSVGSSTTNSENMLIVKGKNNYSDGTTWFGDYGQILLSATTNMTGSARQFLITNALDNNKFAIVRSVDTGTVPVVNSTDSGVNSGIADFVIDNSGKIGIGTDTPLSQLHVVGTTRLTGGSFGVSTDASVSSSFSYSFRDAVGINNPNSVSAPSVVGYVMTVGRSTSSGVGGGIYVEGESRFVRGLAGAIKFNAYGAGTLVSDASGNITTYSGTTPPSGVGAAGRLTIWDSGTELGNSAQLNWDFSNNRLGIGTTSPGYKLHVNGNAYINTTLYVNGQATFDDQVNVTSGYSINFGTSRLHSTSTSYLLGGNVGIGVVNPETSRLLVRGSTNDSSSNIFQAANLGGATKYVVRADGDNKWYKGDNSLSMILTSTGRVGIGTTSPATNFVVSDGGGTGLEITPQDADTKISIVAYDRIDFAYRELNFDGYNYSFRTSGNVKAVMLNNGNVGIGTTSPAAKLNVVGTTGLPATSGTAFTGTMRLGVSGYGTVMDFGAVGPSTGTQWIQVTDASNQALHYPLLLQPNGGNVGIGTTSPGQKLSVQGDSTAAAGRFTAGGNTNTLELFGSSTTGQSSGLLVNAGTNTADYAARFRNAAGSVMMNIRGDGNVGIGTTSPSTTLHVATDSGVLIKGASGSVSAKISFLPASGGRQYDLGNVGSDFRIFDNSANVTRMYFDADGNTGIGTTTPDHELHVAGTVKWEGVGTSGLLSGGETYVSVSQSANSYDLRLGYDNGDFTIKGDGKIGIGLTNPGSKLTVSSPLSGNGTSVDFQIDGGSGFGMKNLQVEIPNNGSGIRVLSPTTGAGDNAAMSFYQVSSQVGSITMGTSTTSFNTTSDYRLKENKEDISDAIERVKKLKPVKFNWIKEPNELKVDGFYAHELADIVPEAVTGKKDALDHDGNPAYQAIDQSKIVPLLAAALQQAIDKIEQLETRIQTIENN